MRETLAIPLGVGIGLTFDESALLLDLEDVYWSREGLVGVQITLATASLMAAGMLALRILRRGEREMEERHELPPPRARPVPGLMSAELREQYLDLLKLTLTGLAEAQPAAHRVRKDGSVRVVPADLAEREVGRTGPRAGSRWSACSGSTTCRRASRACLRTASRAT